VRPLTVVTGILLGSCLSISVSLGAVLVIFLVLADDYPRLNAEFGVMLSSLGVFSAMTVLTGLSFYSLLIGHSWRMAAQLAMWLGLLAMGVYYWP
jgi:hypothetical protein